MKNPTIECLRDRMRPIFKPDALGVQKAPSWSFSGGGYPDEWDNYHHTGNYRGTCVVWIGREFPHRDSCGYQPSNRIYLELITYRLNRRRHAVSLKVWYQGFEMALGSWRTTSLARAGRQALWRWRNGDHGGLAAVFRAYFANRVQVWRVGPDGQWAPYCTAFPKWGVSSPGSVLGYGEFLLLKPGSSYQTLNVTHWGTGGLFGARVNPPTGDHWIVPVKEDTAIGSKDFVVTDDPARVAEIANLPPVKLLDHDPSSLGGLAR